MQVQTPTSLISYDSVFHGLHEIYHNEGPKALFRGTVARALNNGLSTGILLGTYGVLRAQMAQRLGHGSPAATEGSGAYGYEPATHQRARLQTWYTEEERNQALSSTLYNEGAWPATPPATLPPAADVPATSANTDASAPLPIGRDQGFIRPLPWLNAIESWSASNRSVAGDASPGKPPGTPSS